jgi:hypothetical protein
VLSGAGGVSFVSWDGVEAVQTADIEGDEVLLQQTASSPRRERWAQASAPTGHVIVALSSELQVLSFGRGGPATVIPFPTSSSRSRPIVTFDGTRFLFAWAEPFRLMLASLVPGTGAISNPVVVANVSAELLAMASSGGVTWLVWAKDTAVKGVRIVDGAPIDAAPVMIHQDPRINPASDGGIRIEASSGRFLIAVETFVDVASSTLLVPLDSNAMRGTVIEIPGRPPQLARDVAGFATMDVPFPPSADWDAKTFSITRRALDGTPVSAQEVSGVLASLGFDGNRLLLALRQDFLDGEEGDSALSVGPLDDASGVEIVRIRGALRKEQFCHY